MQETITKMLNFVIDKEILKEYPDAYVIDKEKYSGLKSICVS